MKVRSVIGAAMVLAGAVANAAGDKAAALPQANTQSGLHYICGGIGSDEAVAMKQAAPRHNLMLTFATKTGDFVSGVDVDIRYARGHSLLKASCDGSIMLVDVPKGGRYRIYGDLNGRTSAADVLVGPDSKGQTVHLLLPGEEARSG